MTKPKSRREFTCEGKRWTVRRDTGSRPWPGGVYPPGGQPGLYFHSDGDTRFLAFSRGTLPSDRDLQSMSEEVLCALLRRAVAQ
jgi:hypothetical protein